MEPEAVSAQPQAEVASTKTDMTQEGGWAAFQVRNYNNDIYYH